MANIDIDTVKIRECGNDIITLSNELGENITGLFDRLKNMPTKTYEWVGQSANSFVNTINIEKIDYINLKNTIYNYGKYLVNTAEELEKTSVTNKYEGN